MDPQSIVNLLTQDTVLVLLAYGLLGGLDLLVIPLALFVWMNSRWPRMGNIERLLVYGLVFLFFPGMIVFAPFLNLRLSGQGEN